MNEKKTIKRRKQMMLLQMLPTAAPLVNGKILDTGGLKTSGTLFGAVQQVEKRGSLGIEQCHAVD